MSVMKLKDYDDEIILDKLRQEEDCPKMLLTITNFAFLKVVQNLMHQLDMAFESKRGRPAYPRTLLLIVVLYCFSRDISNYTKMEEECKTNRFLLIVTCGLKPSRNSFANFLNKSDEKVMKKVFVSTLVLLNDLHFLEFVKLFIDGTDALVRASRNYKLTSKHIERLKLMNQWGLIHDNTPESIERVKKELEEKLKFYENDKEMCKTINSILKRIKIYNIKIFSKLETYERILNERNAKSVSISFPESCWMKTKRGIFDFAFNLQVIMTQNHLILSSTLLAQSNDSKTIPEVIEDLYETIKFFIELRNEYGQRKNKKEIPRRIHECIIIGDSGYFSTKNLHYLFKNKINALIMPKKLSEDYDNDLRRKSGHEEKRKDSTKKQFKRVKNGYKCPLGHFMKLTKIVDIVHRKPHKDDNLPDICKTKKYIYQTSACENCPKIHDCKHKQLTDNTTKLNHQMTEKFLDKRSNTQYSYRFSRSEGINGFLKGDKGVLKLIGTTTTAINNEIQLRNTIYNLTRLVNLKDTAY